MKVKKEIDSSVSKLVLRFKNKCNGSLVYVDSHIVRTLNETVLIEIKDDTVKSVEIASFMEPMEYFPPKKWLEQFMVKEEVDALTGATLTQNAIKNTILKYKILNKAISESN